MMDSALRFREGDDIGDHIVQDGHDIGHPLAGDGKYGTNEFNDKIHMKTQALYSYKLIFEFEDENELSYLNGKEFKVKTVPFENLDI